MFSLAMCDWFSLWGMYVLCFYVDCAFVLDICMLSKI